MIFIVTSKTTGAEVYRYEADAPIEWVGMEFATHDHAEPPPAAEPQNEAAAPRRMSKLAFIDRLGDDAYKAILAISRVNLDVEAFVKRFEMTTPDPDGTSVDLADRRTIAGVTLIGAALYANGVVPQDWAQEVLNGN